MKAAGLYIHIPFCEAKCHYCDFVITTKRGPGDRRRFLDCLEKEVRRAAEAKWGKILAEPTTNGDGAASAELAGKSRANPRPNNSQSTPVAFSRARARSAAARLRS